ncbi:hypothetical protein PROFUN_09933 [Planoprotostelium fungivorum]|uniref:Uncharacterized protein n=1 Tax=Planoprotostelium fungivorum TaxID=1890364 RepID=A0A2P6NGC7_9EUKA|nr:hypothetical protein PROFUN_09933 [Planoprotostelium fungivorum]
METQEELSDAIQQWKSTDSESDLEELCNVFVQTCLCCDILGNLPFLTSVHVKRPCEWEVKSGGVTTPGYSATGTLYARATDDDGVKFKVRIIKYKDYRLYIVMGDLEVPDTLSMNKRRAVSEASVDKCKIEEQMDALSIQVDNLARSHSHHSRQLADHSKIHKNSNLNRITEILDKFRGHDTLTEHMIAQSMGIPKEELRASLYTLKSQEKLDVHDDRWTITPSGRDKLSRSISRDNPENPSLYSSHPSPSWTSSPQHEFMDIRLPPSPSHSSSSVSPPESSPNEQAAIPDDNALANAVITFMRREGRPLKAHEIVKGISRQFPSVEKPSVNRVLYHDLAGQVVKLPGATWKAIDIYKHCSVSIVLLDLRKSG